MTPINVLLVEDDPGDAALIRERLLTRVGGDYLVTHVPRLADAVKRLARGGIDVVLVDLGLPDSTGLESARRVREAAPDVPIVVLTGLDDDELAFQAVREGLEDYLAKDRADGGVLHRAIHYALERHRLLQKVEESADDARRSEGALRSVIDANLDGMVILDASGTVRLVNPAAERLTGRTRADLVGSELGFPLPEGDTAEVTLAGGDGTQRTLEVRVAPLAWQGELCRLASLHDLTDRRRTEETLREREEQLRQALKLEAVGLLAGGIAHDFNNLLTVILGRCELARQRPQGDPQVREDLDTIRGAAERGATLTRQLLAFGRRQPLSPQVLDVNAVISEIHPILAALAKESVDLVIDLAPDTPPVRADRSQLEQVLINLVMNARDAMAGGGRLVVATAPEELDADWCARHVGVEPGRFARLDVRDTGHGMEPAVRERVFEPFFTTKPAGRGTGLGLSTAYGIVKQSGGLIEVTSEVGRGTTFSIRLPAVAAESNSARSVAARRAIPGRPATVLLVEDDEALRVLARDALELAGHTVLEADGGAAALRFCRDYGHPIDLLVTDVVMPGLTGPDLAREALPLRPGMRVLFVSGYTGRSLGGAGLPPRSEFLQKPFTLEQLADRVHRLLGAKDRA